MAPTIVHKFGGTSVGDADCFRQVVEIIQSCTTENIAIVVSGMGGKPKVTDLLLNLIDLAKSNQLEMCEEILQCLEEKHATAISSLLPESTGAAILTTIQQDLVHLRDIVKAISIMQSCEERIMELICGYGELWSAQVLTALLRLEDESYQFVDARKVLKVRPQTEQGPMVLWERSRELLEQYLTTDKPIKLVITGFICSTEDGTPTTLKRDGSDFSASIFAKLLDTRNITIWTDVNGVFSADPRRVPESKPLDCISYKEAMELAYFGAKVIHPKTMAPAISKKIPIYIKNTFNPEHPGTKIYEPQIISKEERLNSGGKIVSGFSTIDDLALFNLEGNGMVGVHGVASRLFNALEKEKINVVLIAQASSEHSICFAIPMDRAEAAKQAIEEAFFREFHHGHIQTIEYISPVSIIAAVGDNMSQTPGVCALFFGAFKRAQINVLGISQGSSERNISAVVHSNDSGAALRAVHSAFFLSPQTISIGIITNDPLFPTANLPDLVLSSRQTLLRQIQNQSEWLNDRYHVDIRVRGLYSDKEMRLHPIGMDLNNWEDATTVEIADMKAFTSHIQAAHLPHSLIIDLTHDACVAESYPGWLNERTNIISANLMAASCPMPLYHEIDHARCKNKVSLSMDVCVGTGLPVLHMLRNLLQTGDPILSIEGELSATMSYVLCQMHTTDIKFSEAAREALRRGYTGVKSFSKIIEDFTGITSARKLLVLARQLGLEIELEAISVEPFLKLPQEFSGNVEADEFMTILELYDDAMRERVNFSKINGRQLKLISKVQATGETEVKLCEIPSQHPFSSLSGAGNAVAFYTERYRDHPLCVNGPASGPSILAGAVFGNILGLARELGARDHGTGAATTAHTPEKPFKIRMSPSQSASDLLGV